MTEAIAIILGATSAGSLVAIIWLVYRVVSATDALADARVAQVTTEEHLESTALERDQLKQALAQRDQALNTLSKEYSDVLTSYHPNADLPPADLHDRISRIYGLFAQLSAPASASGVAGPAAALPPDPAAHGTDAGSKGG